MTGIAWRTPGTICFEACGCNPSFCEAVKIKMTFHVARVSYPYLWNCGRTNRARGWTHDEMMNDDVNVITRKETQWVG
jgi:hypothetical protein